MKTVNLEEILSQQQFDYFDETGYNSFFKTSEKVIIINAMREACNQTVELCKENIIDTTLKSSESDTSFTSEQIKSIENTKNQIV